MASLAEWVRGVDADSLLDLAVSVRSSVEGGGGGEGEEGYALPVGFEECEALVERIKNLEGKWEGCRTCPHTCIRAPHTHARTHAHTYTHTNTYIHIHTYTYKYIHTHTNTHTHRPTSLHRHHCLYSYKDEFALECIRT